MLIMSTSNSQNSEKRTVIGDEDGSITATTTLSDSLIYKFLKMLDVEKASALYHEKSNTNTSGIVPQHGNNQISDGYLNLYAVTLIIRNRVI
jgi:hypothetical protein